MLDSIIKGSLENRLVVLAIALLLSLWGGIKAVQMPIDVFPDLTAPRVTVIADVHGMAPRELERLVTIPLESALNGASRVRRVRSATSVGIVLVWVEFEWGTDIYLARQIVAEKLQLVRAELPPQLDAPIMAPVTSIMGEIMFLALTSDRHTPMQLKSAGDWLLRRRLLAVPGVAQVVTIGGDTKQYQVLVRPERLSAYGLTLEQVLEALKKTNSNTSAGFYLARGQEYLIQGLGRVHRLADIEKTVVAMRQGEAVLMRHVARVRIGAALKRGIGSLDAKPAVILGIQKQPTANTLALTARLDTVLTSLQASLPSGMKVHRHIFRQADFIEAAVKNVVVALRDGALLVVLVVLLFLASLRSTAITIVAMPLSLLTAVLLLEALGASINTMTLGGMAIAIGALVDDAIIDVENVVRRLRQNHALPESERRPTTEVVFAASKEIRSSIVYATLIIVLVFLPLFFLSGVEGRLLRPLGLAYVVALAASLIVALTVTPALCSLLLPRARTVTRAVSSRLTQVLESGYRRLLAQLIERWRTIAVVALAAVLVSLVALAGVGRSFLPEFNEGALTLSAVTVPGTSLSESDRLGQRIEQILLTEPEVVATARRTGRGSFGEHAMGVNSAEIDVRLRMKGRSKQAFLAALRRKLSAVPGTNIVIGQPISHRIDHMLSGTRANIAVKIFGPDLHELRKLAAAVEPLMRKIRGVADLAIESQADVPLVTIKFDREALARYGLAVHDVAETVEAAFAGRAVSQVREGEAAFELVGRYHRSALASLATIRQTLVTTASGARVPLSALAAIRRDLGPNTIRRENAQRRIVVMCNVAGRDLSSVVEDIRGSIGSGVRFPSGYHVEYGGQFESASRAARTLLLVGALVVVGIFVLLVLALGSARDAALVMVNLPLALAGGVLAIVASKGVLSVATIIGLITLFGIATRNGLMMISHIHHLIDVEGLTDFRQAVERGAVERLAPILMTALAAGLALIPLALSGGEPGSEIQAPMAIVILWGLLTSTALNMIVMPAFYLRFGAKRPAP